MVEFTPALEFTFSSQLRNQGTDDYVLTDNCSQSVIAFSQIGSSTGKVNGCATRQIKHDLSVPGSEHEKVPVGIPASLRSE